MHTFDGITPVIDMKDPDEHGNVPCGFIHPLVKVEYFIRYHPKDFGGSYEKVYTRSITLHAQSGNRSVGNRKKEGNGRFDRTDARFHLTLLFAVFLR